MATFNISFLSKPHSTLPVFSNFSSQNTPSFSSYSLPKTSLLFPSITLRPKTRTRTRRIVVAALKKLSETDPLTVPIQPDEISGSFPKESGVYAVYDSNGDLQFVGISRNIAASVLSHKNSVPQLCSSVKCLKLLEREIVLVECTQRSTDIIEGIYFTLGYLPHYIMPRRKNRLAFGLVAAGHLAIPSFFCCL